MLIRREVVLIEGAAPPMSTVSAHKLNKNKNKNCQPSSGLPITDVIAHVAHGHAVALRISSIRIASWAWGCT